MKMPIRCLVFALGFFPLIVEAAEVGTAKIDITPGFPIRLHGYSSRSQEATKIETRLWAKAVAIGPAVIVSVDNLGVPDAVVSDVLARVRAEAPEVTRERFAVCSTHTHSAPVLLGAAANIFGKPLPPDQQAHIERYTRELADSLVKVVLEALADRKPATLAWGQGSVGFAINRRVLKDGKWTGFGEVPDGPVDHSLPIVRAVDARGNLRAVIVDYACHCTTLDPKDNAICADWAGFAQDAIEAAHPGAVALTVIGCGADANPRGRTGLAVAQKHGKSLADEVERLLRDPLKPLDGPPTGRFERISLPFDHVPTRDELQALIKGKDGAAAYNARTMLDRLDRGETLPDALPYPIQTWAFGDRLCLVFLGGEVVVDYALRLKTELDPSRLMVISYANDVPCYIASERILNEGGYEATGAMFYYGRPSRLKPGVEDLIISAVRSMTPATFRAAKPTD